MTTKTSLAFECILSLILVLSLCAFGQPTEVWSRNYGGQSSDPGGAVKSTYDGGYILTGTTYSYGLGRGDLWLVKTDSNGTEQWNKTFGGRNFDIGRSVQQTSDEGYIIAGSTQSFGVRNSDAWLIKTDKSGTEQWNRTFGGRSTDEATSVQQTDDGATYSPGSPVPTASEVTYGWSGRTPQVMSSGTRPLAKTAPIMAGRLSRPQMAGL